VIRPLPQARPDGRTCLVTAGIAGPPDRQEKAMLINPDQATRLTRDHYDELLTQASRRQLRPRPGRQATRTRGTAGIGRRLAAAIARAMTAQAPGPFWPTGGNPLGEPVTQARTPRT
jgi:hypothetical protein